MFEPADQSVLIDALQSDVDVSATVTYTPVFPEVLESLEWVTDLPAEVSVSVDGDTLTVSVDSFDFLFPVQSIKYLLNGVIGECFLWADLPEEADQIIEYLPATVSVKTYNLTVTAATNLATESADYIIQITANYETGKLKLREAINARRN
jgi:hypothetical protein